MKKVALLAGVLLPAAFAAASTISVISPDPVVLGTASVVVNLNISGGESIGGAQTVLIIGDGGPNLGGSDTIATSPKITGGTMIAPGMVFATSNTGDGYFQVDAGSGPEPLAAGNGTTTAGTTTVVASGLLMSFTVSLQGVPAGTYPLNLSLDNSAVIGAPVTVQSGTLTIIPEPASALLLIGALPFLRRRSA